MMSLFSSFDIKFWNYGALLLMSYLVSLLIKSWVNSMLFNSIRAFQVMMFSFFSSLNTNKMFKMSLPMVFSMMVFVFLTNFSSVFSFSFPHTSQVSVVLSMSLIWWFSIISIFALTNPKGMLFHFIPEGSPIYMVPLLFLAELVSSLIRPITLTVRLAANILAGHLLMSLLGSLIFSFYFFAPTLMVLNLVEFFVSAIQAYIFATMIVLYFSEFN